MMAESSLLLAAASLLMLVTGSSAFTCYACLPDVVGTKVQKQAAMHARANITRTFPSVTEQQMGDCSTLEEAAKYMLECPTDDQYTTCVRMTHSLWTGHSCGKITEDYGAGCHTITLPDIATEPITYCQCVSPLCNNPAGPSAVPYASLLALMVIVSLV